MTQKRAVIYMRVSGKKQDALTQIDQCRAYCEKHGFTIVDEIADKITGDSAVREREGGKRVYALLRRKAVDAVVMWVIDRVARDEDVVEYGIFKRDIKRAGARLHFTDRGETVDDPIAAQSEFAESAGAAKERKKIVMRTMAGKKRQVKEYQRIITGGQIPFGYRKRGIGKESFLEIDPLESALVQDLFRWYADHVPMMTILERVVFTGIPTKNRGRWSTSGIVSMLRNPSYKGVFSFGQDTLDKPELMIVDSVTWQTVQDLLVEHRWQKTSNPGQYLLSQGRVRCFCGGAMTGCTSYATAGGVKQVYRYYRCTSGHNLEKGNPKRCGKMIRSDKLDQLAWGWLLMLSMSEEHLSDLFEQARENILENTQPIQERIDSLTSSLKDSEAEVARLVRRMSKIEDDAIALSYENEIAQITKSREAIRTQIDKAQVELARYGAAPGGKTDKEAMIKQLNRLVAARTFEERRHSIEYFDVQAWLIRKPTGIKIRLGCFLLGDDDEEYDLEGEGGYPAYLQHVEFVGSNKRLLNRATVRKGVWIHETVALEQYTTRQSPRNFT